MKKPIVIRTGKDRLRYTGLFELFLLMVLAPIGAFVFDRQLLDIGMLSLVLSLKAMIVNLIYNLIFDLVDVRAGRIPSQRTILGRILHAAGFEVGLVVTSLPIVTWWLGLTILQALMMDMIVTSFIVLYTLIFTWGYDRYFPVRQ